MFAQNRYLQKNSSKAGNRQTMTNLTLMFSKGHKFTFTSNEIMIIKDSHFREWEEYFFQSALNLALLSE